MTLDQSFDFGLCSTETLSSISSSQQYTFHLSLNTTIHFTTIVNGKECTVRFTFHPFRRYCNLTYHEYDIQCSIPFGISDTLCKRSIVEVAQRIYERYFFQNARYKLALLESE